MKSIGALRWGATATMSQPSAFTASTVRLNRSSTVIGSVTVRISGYAAFCCAATSGPGYAGGFGASGWNVVLLADSKHSGHPNPNH